MRKMSRRARQTPEEPAASESRMALDRLFRVPGEGPWGAVAAAVATAGGERLWASPEGSGRFDLASLTKPFVATLALVLDRTGGCRSACGGIALPEAVPCSRAARSRRCCGTGPVCGRGPLPRLVRHRDAVVRLLAGPRFQGAPPGTYSDLGYILWGLAAERALGEPLAALLAREPSPAGARGPLALLPGLASTWCRCRSTTGGSASRPRARIGLGRRPARTGEVQDGTPAGSAAVPATPGFRRSREPSRAGAGVARTATVLTPELVRRALAGGGPYALGWARRRVREARSRPSGHGVRPYRLHRRQPLARSGAPSAARDRRPPARSRAGSQPLAAAFPRARHRSGGRGARELAGRRMKMRRPREGAGEAQWNDGSW